MEINDLFRHLVQFHSEHNLKNSLPYINEGTVLDRFEQPYKEGKDNNETTKGFLIICNGNTLIDKLQNDNMIDGMVLDDMPLKFHDINGYEGLRDYIIGEEDADGAYIFDRHNSRITRVGELGNNPPGLKYTLTEMLNQSLPEDFISYDGSIPVHPLGIGSKTKIAIKIPKAYPYVEALQIKKSAYGQLGLGKVTHFTNDGLVKEFFFDQGNGEYFDEKNSIIGTLREYDKSGRYERNIGPSYF